MGCCGRSWAGRWRRCCALDGGYKLVTPSGGKILSLHVSSVLNLTAAGKVCVGPNLEPHNTSLAGIEVERRTLQSAAAIISWYARYQGAVTQ